MAGAKVFAFDKIVKGFTLYGRRAGRRCPPDVCRTAPSLDCTLLPTARLAFSNDPASSPLRAHGDCQSL